MALISIYKAVQWKYYREKKESNDFTLSVTLYYTEGINIKVTWLIVIIIIIIMIHIFCLFSFLRILKFMA